MESATIPILPLEIIKIILDFARQSCILKNNPKTAGLATNMMDDFRALTRTVGITTTLTFDLPAFVVSRMLAHPKPFVVRDFIGNYDIVGTEIRRSMLFYPRQIQQIWFLASDITVSADTCGPNPNSNREYVDLSIGSHHCKFIYNIAGELISRECIGDISFVDFASRYLDLLFPVCDAEISRQKSFTICVPSLNQKSKIA